MTNRIVRKLFVSRFDRSDGTKFNPFHIGFYLEKRLFQKAKKVALDSGDKHLVAYLGESLSRAQFSKHDSWLTDGNFHSFAIFVIIRRNGRSRFNELPNQQWGS